MSSTGRGRERQPRDYYPTPAPVVRACLDLLDLRPDQHGLEPSAGTGAWLGPMLDRLGHVDAVEIDRKKCKALRELRAGHETPGSVICTDFTEHMPPGVGATGMYDWIIGNPPFSVASQHVQHAHWLLKPGGRLAFLLGSGWLHTAGRRWLRERFALWRDYGIEGRPPFMQAVQVEGTDSVEYSLFVWQRGYTGSAPKRYFSWKDGAPVAEDREKIRALDWSHDSVK